MSPDITNDILRRLRPYFDESRPSPPEQLYVAWLDVMGTSSVIRRSISIAANFVWKLHISALDARVSQSGVDLFPAVDGIYICSQNYGPLLGLLRDTLYRLALAFNVENDNLERFCARAGIAYGRVWKGGSVKSASPSIRKNPGYFERILIGLPLVQAYESEKLAPPFGVYLHESARAFSPEGKQPLTFVLWKWWKMDDRDGSLTQEADHLSRNLGEYFSWYERRSSSTFYTKEDIARHRAMATEYFSE